MDPRERYSEAEVMFRTILDGSRTSLWTALPGNIVSFDADAVTAVVQPGIAGTVTMPDGSSKIVNLPILPDVQVVFPGGGGCRLTFPIQPGDECMLVFSSRALDAWAQSGGVQAPSDARLHDLSDAFAVIGPMSQANKISGVSTTTTQLRSNDGSTYVELDPAGQVVHVKAPGGMTIDADVQVNGKVTTTQDIKSTGGDVVAGSVSLKDHLTTGVTAGSGLSGKPQQ